MMLNKITNYLMRIKRRMAVEKTKTRLLSEKNEYISNGRIPWSTGYSEFKKQFIKDSLNNEALLESFRFNGDIKNYGLRLDERVVEYPWLFTNIPNNICSLLDAGSTLNFDFIIAHKKLENKDLTIYTFAPEDVAFYRRRVSYVYGDLRDMYFKNEIFDMVISQSTIEHIDMDNSMYGYDLEYNQNVNDKSYEYLIAIYEMIRVLKSGGTLLLTFPYGKFENHGFFQQLDEEMVRRIYTIMHTTGNFKTTFFKYEPDGWRFSDKEDVNESESFNPHTGKGKKDDFAAHSRAIACIKFNKN